MNNVFQVPEHWFVKWMKKKTNLPKQIVSETLQRTVKQEETFQPTCEHLHGCKTRHRSHIYKELKGTTSGAAPIPERATTSYRFPTERAELGVQRISSKKAFKCPDTLSLTPLAPQTMPGWLSGFISWKNSLIKIQTVTVSPLLKGLKSVLC